MKTRHVVAIGILTAIAVGLLAIGIKLTGQKPKVQTKAANQTLTTTAVISKSYECKAHVNNTISLTNEIINTLTNTNNTPENIITSKLTDRGQIDLSYFYIYWNASYSQTSQTDLSPYNIQVNKADIVITKIECENFNASAQTTDIKINCITRYYYDTTPIAQSNTTTITITNANTNAPSTNYIDSNEVITFDKIDINTFTPNDFNLFSNGFDNALTYGQNQYQNGYNEGYDNGYNEAYDYAYETGYSTGYQTKGDLSDGNFLSIQEAMLNVLTMPFTFISQGFNVTLWEGTPYQINIGNFIKSLIAIATILFIIKMFTSGFSIIGNYTSGTGANISQWRKNRSERKLNESKARLNDRTNPNHKTRDSHVTIKKE